MFATSLSAELVDRLGWVLVHSIWQLALLGLIAAALAWSLRGRTAAARYGTLLLPLMAMTVTPVATWFWLDANMSQEIVPHATTIGPIAAPGDDMPELVEAEQGFVAPALEQPNLGTEVVIVDPLPAEIAPGDVAETPLGWQLDVAAALRPWLGEMVLAWCVGVLLFAQRPLLSWLTMRRLRVVGVSAVPDALLRLMENSSQRLGVRRAVSVSQSALVNVPVVIGYFRPTILLPLSLVSSVPMAQLEAILTHELAHIRRHDYLVNLAQILIETVFFYHPAVWWLSRKIRAERENCCDDLAVAALGNRAEYGRALLAVAELSGSSTALVLSASDGPLISRIRRIVGAPAGQGGGFPWAVLCLLLCCLGAIGGVYSLDSVRADTQEQEEEVGPADVEMTTVLVEWYARVNEDVLREIRDLDESVASDSDEAEVFRCSGDALRMVMRRHLGEWKTAELGTATDSAPELLGPGMGRLRTGSFGVVDGKSYLQLSWQATGQATLDTEETPARLRANITFLIRNKFRASYSEKLNSEEQDEPNLRAGFMLDEPLAEGDAVGFVGSHTFDSRWPMYLLAVYERMQIPLDQVDTFHPEQDPTDWVCLGPTGTARRFGRVAESPSNQRSEVFRLNPQWTRTVGGVGHLQLVALSRPKLAPMIWWTPEGEFILVDGPLGIHRSKHDAVALVRIWEDGVDRNVLGEEESLTRGKIDEFPDDCPETPGSQLAVVAFDKDGQPWPTKLRIGSGFGPWQAETKLAAEEEAVTRLQDAEIIFKRVMAVDQGPDGRWTRTVYTWQPRVEGDVTTLVIAKDGRQIREIGNPSIKTDDTQKAGTYVTSATHEIDPGEIEHFLIKTRPVQWVEFTGYARQPIEPPSDFDPPEKETVDEVVPNGNQEEEPELAASLSASKEDEIGEPEEQLRLILDKVRRNEALFANLDVSMRTKFTLGPKVDASMFEVASKDYRTSFVQQGDLFRLELDGDSHTKEGKAYTCDRVMAFDGSATLQLERNEIRSVTAGRRTDTNFIRPHMLLLRSQFYYPLSTFLGGYEAIREDPYGRRNENGTLVVTYEGESDVEELKCHRVHLTGFGEGAEEWVFRWELWLAEDRNYIPAQVRSYTRRFSEDSPIARASVHRWEEVTPGVWWPAEGEYIRFDKIVLRDEGRTQVRSKEEYRLEDVALDPSYEQSFFQDVPFPTGTVVHEVKPGAEE